MKVYIINGSIEYDCLFNSLGYKMVYEVEHADLVCFTGGHDVTPSLYGQSNHPKTVNHELRDAVESGEYEKAKELGIPMVGICRGAQFLHVMNGGSLYQHVDGHDKGAHKLYDTHTDEECMVTSTHHQMMADVGIGDVVGVASEATKLEYMHGHRGEYVNPMIDIEVVWHGNTKCLCFQPHPEFSHAIEGAESTYLYFKNLLTRYLGEKYVS